MYHEAFTENFALDICYVKLVSEKKKGQLLSCFIVLAGTVLCIMLENLTVHQQNLCLDPLSS